MFPLRDNVPSRRTPYVTYSLLAFNMTIFALELLLPNRQLTVLIYTFGIVPKRFSDPAWAAEVGLSARSYWPFLTSMFLHGGWLHVISNMWTLWIFGDNVEDRMGSARFLIFYLLCGVVSGLMHYATNTGSAVPAIGASGAIAGVLAAYLMLFPKARVLCLIPIFIFPLFIELYAFVFIIIWAITQFYSGTLSLVSPGYGGGIAWWAHIGGFLGGIVFYGLFLRRHKQPTTAEPPPLPPPRSPRWP